MPGFQTEYAWWQRIHYHFNWNVDRVVIHTQANVEDLRIPETPTGLVLRFVDPDDADDAQLWAEIVNRSFTKENADEQTFKAYWQAHPQLILKEMIVAELDGQPVATISNGVYRADTSVGGAFRAAVLPHVRSRGLGEWLYAVAFQRTQQWGVQRLEGLTLVRTRNSLRIQLRIGMRLQDDYSKVLPTGQLRRWPARELAVRRARRIRDELYEERPDLR